MEDNFPTHPPVRAWRCFDITVPTLGGTPYLASPMAMGGRLFPNQVYFAECSHTLGHKAPKFNCTCGFYAFKKRRDARNYLRHAVMAEVLLGGKIIETEIGYRAEQMIIIKIYWNKGVSHELRIH